MRIEVTFFQYFSPHLFIFLIRKTKKRQAKNMDHAFMNEIKFHNVNHLIVDAYAK